MALLQKGDVVYGGLPRRSSYYTNEVAIFNSQGNKNLLYKSLQVRMNPERGAYRPNIGVYEITEDLRVPVSIVSSNPIFGPGGEAQFFIGNFLSKRLVLSNEMELKEFYEQAVSTYRLSN